MIKLKKPANQAGSISIIYNLQLKLLQSQELS